MANLQGIFGLQLTGAVSAEASPGGRLDEWYGLQHVCVLYRNVQDVHPALDFAQKSILNHGEDRATGYRTVGCTRPAVRPTALKHYCRPSDMRSHRFGSSGKLHRGTVAATGTPSQPQQAGRVRRSGRRVVVQEGRMPHRGQRGRVGRFGGAGDE